MIRKIAILIECLRIGGVEHFALDLANHLAHESWETHVVCLADNEPHDNSRLPARLYRTNPGECSRLLQDLRPELISLHLRSHPQHLMQELTQAPKVITSETLPDTGISYAALIYPAKAFSPQTAATGNVILPGIDPARLQNGEGWRIRAELNIDDDAFVLGYIGRMTPESNCSELLESFAQARKGYSKIILVIAGDGPQGEKLIRRSREKDLDGGVRFAGLRTDLADLFACFDALVIPSTKQQFPLVALEARASGTPVIVTPEIHRLLPDNTGWSIGTLDNLKSILTELKSTTTDHIDFSIQNAAELYSQLFTKVIASE